MLKGDLAFQQSQYQDALAAYIQADRMAPNNREVRRKISVVLTLLGRAEEARQYK
jgi:Flp pilus assembly protein TadD